MSILIDIVLVAIVIAIVVVSAKKGIVITLLEIVAFVAAIFLASQCAAPVASTMYTGFFQKTVQRELYDVIPSNVSMLSSVEKAQRVWENIPDFAKNYAEKVGVDVSAVTEKIAITQIPDGDEAYIEIEKQIVKPIAVAVLKNIMFFVLAILFGIILRAVAKGISKTIQKTKGLGSLDKMIGGVLGIVKGLVVVFLICFLLSYIKPRIDNNDLRQGIEESSIINAAENFDPMDAITAAAVYASNEK